LKLRVPERSVAFPFRSAEKLLVTEKALPRSNVKVGRMKVRNGIKETSNAPPACASPLEASRRRSQGVTLHPPQLCRTLQFLPSREPSELWDTRIELSCDTSSPEAGTLSSRGDELSEAASAAIQMKQVTLLSLYANPTPAIRLSKGV
jgi:hypothetical protein